MIGSSTIFDTLPIFNTFANFNTCNDQPYHDDYYDLNNTKRRRINPQYNKCSTSLSNNKSSQLSVLDQYSDNEEKVTFLLNAPDYDNSNSFQLQIAKPIAHSKLGQAINRKVNKLKEQLYPPEYQMVTDTYGNQYYMEMERSNLENLQIDKLIRDKVNVNDVIAKVCHRAFKDYQIDLSRRGDNIIITSKVDRLHKELALPYVIDDFNILNYDIDTTGLDTASFKCIMNIELIKHDAEIRDAHYHSEKNINELINGTEDHIKKRSKKKARHHHRHHHNHHRKHTHKVKKTLTDHHNLTSHTNSLSQSHIFYHPILEEVKDEDFNIDSNHILNQDVNYVIDEI